MPKKYWFLFLTAGVLLCGNTWLIYTTHKDKVPSQHQLIVGDSTLYPTLEVNHLTMKPAWYQFTVPAIALPAPPTQTPQIYFIAKPDKQQPTLTHWFLINQTGKTQKLVTQNGSILMIQEARDAKGRWRPVEYWTEQWGTAALPPINGVYTLEPTKALMTVAPRYKGTLKTLLRFKLKLRQENGKEAIHYSPTFEGSVLPSQFELSPEDKKKRISFLD